MARPPAPEFGKRRSTLPDMPPPTSPPKRSRHVALLVMGTLAVGGGAYALMPGQSCQPPAPAPGVATTVPSQPGAGCVSRGSSGGSGGSGGRSSGYSFFGGSSSSGGSSTAVTQSSSSVSRGGFGSFGRAFASGS